MNTTSNRFTNAVTKLYNAFHKGELNAMDTCACAVGNICDNSDEWRTDMFQKKKMYSVPLEWQKYTGYSELEIFNIESLFMWGMKEEEIVMKWSSDLVNSKKYNNVVFEATCAVIEYLCELEGIPNVMDYTKLFETENDAPAYKLETILI